jgi:hypothetical protein
MLANLHDALLRLWPWNWPTTEGEVTAVGLEHCRNSNSADEVTLSVSYKFSVNGHGPYTGIRMWTSTHYLVSDLLNAENQYREAAK